MVVQGLRNKAPLPDLAVEQRVSLRVAQMPFRQCWREDAFPLIEGWRNQLRLCTRARGDQKNLLPWNDEGRDTSAGKHNQGQQRQFATRSMSCANAKAACQGLGRRDMLPVWGRVAARSNHANSSPLPADAADVADPGRGAAGPAAAGGDYPQSANHHR